jgi:hypothetical protein
MIKSQAIKSRAIKIAIIWRCKLYLLRSSLGGLLSGRGGRRSGRAILLAPLPLPLALLLRLRKSSAGAAVARGCGLGLLLHAALLLLLLPNHLPLLTPLMPTIRHHLSDLPLHLQFNKLRKDRNFYK